MNSRKSDEGKDEEQNIISHNENEYIMGRKVYVKIPLLHKIIAFTYCQLFQLIIGLFYFKKIIYYNNQRRWDLNNDVRCFENSDRRMFIIESK